MNKEHVEYPYLNSSDLREQVWNQLVDTSPKPPMMTLRRIKKAKEILWNNNHFWWDILDRHGLKDNQLKNLELELQKHVIGNFWGHLCSTCRRKVKKNKNYIS